MGVFLRTCLLALLALVSSSLLAAQVLPPTHVDDFAGKPRVVVISDIGNEPDDQMSFVRFLLYSNEFDIEAMIATTSTWQKTKTHAETMHQLIEAYGQVRPNLLLHAKGWPEASDLDARVFTGQTAYGMGAVGHGQVVGGVAGNCAALERDDPRPLWICIWGGASTLAQALMDLPASHTPPRTGEVDREAAGVFDQRPGRCGAVIRQAVSGVVLYRVAIDADERGVCVGDVDGNQRGPLLPQRRGRGFYDGDERVA